MLRSILTATMFLLASTAASAGASVNASASAGAPTCAIRFAADVELSPRQVIIDDGRRRHAIADGAVLSNGRRLHLDTHRQRLAHDYAEGMREAVPAASEVAVRSALLGLESLALVAAGLSGEGATTESTVARIETLATRLHQQFDGRRIRAGQLGLSPPLERDLGALAAAAAGEFAGSLIGFIGTALFEPGTADARAQYLERLIDRRIAPRAAQIEAQAGALCALLHRLDALESQLGLFDVIVNTGDAHAI